MLGGSSNGYFPRSAAAAATFTQFAGLRFYNFSSVSLMLLGHEFAGRQIILSIV